MTRCSGCARPNKSFASWRLATPPLLGRRLAWPWRADSRAGFCAGTPLELMEETGRHTTFADFGRWTPSWLGLATNQRMEKYITRLTSVTTFEELKTPLAISTTDINAGISVYYSSGPLAPPLRASCAYPGLFVPIQFEGRTLVDGFL